ncbi:molybdopterin-dependent oxidoreductase [Actinomadura sp. 7K534]|uniref:molybdopterin-dependent oxidoreductase n=1 Tax=Actinomadura sp. 7K534 TaxID=2530366 RepID=UPI00104B9DAD|nr:molybdopterin-dependent oxidoreductase [Actinomadura sp. 7K534]TDB94166.1 molybdopterin-binding protein [Actinomadura sp. 7K534]
MAAWLGIWLGVAFTSAFVTGLISHFMQQPPGWLMWPSRPVNLYRVTQGLHVIGGLATIPLLLAKMWTVYPRLFQWPPVRSVGHAVERALIFVLVGAALFQVVTGLLNISYWYAFPFFFTSAHYWTAYILVGALVIHVVNKWPKVHRTVMKHPEDGLNRRGFLLGVAAASGTVAVTMVGEAFSPLAKVALLAPRRPGVGPQGVPVNRSAYAAGVNLAAANDPAWRLQVTGRVQRELSLSLEELQALPSHSARLPIACVEGWSAGATWHGIRLRDLLHMAGVAEDARVRLISMEVRGIFRTSWVNPRHWQDPLTLLALSVNGETLDLDHGFPCRLIAPNRPGVHQTKWVRQVIVV